MKRFILFYSVITLSIYGFSQSADTVLIRNIKNYKEGKVNYLVSPTGKRIQLQVLTKETWYGGDQETEPEADRVPAAPHPTIRMNTESTVSIARGRSYVDPALTSVQKERIKQHRCRNARFAGLSRSRVKTSIAAGNERSYTTLPQFLRTLPQDEDMDDVVDALDEPWQERASQESKNITLTNAYLIAYAREDDNDYHLIITNRTHTTFFNVEISGLPATSASSYNALKSVRQRFESWPGAVDCGRYTKFIDTPILIRRLKGSLFFDTDHAAGSVGPEGFRPETAWEIHPVTYIEF